ncbi:porin [Aquabacterium sp. OR-4]|uniref:porin n=1 Tax=Aquabacterium sp. OR-4 TaxID=2978127 RepID=UPI0021B407BA|nr:porin [Aquabacterium sp. OR-4]MDT7834562.1 porin [Aquabacterium sp. OR-4]
MSTPLARTLPALRMAALPLLLATAGNVQAAEFKAGDWTVSVGGIVNAYYTSVSCSGSQAVSGLTLGAEGLGCGGKSGATNVGNGLLPNALITSVKGKQDGLDIGATLMIGAAVSSSDSIGNNNNVDVRQGFFTIGSASAGTVKLGRDYGLFGANAILSDMTLLGVGAPVQATQGNRVSLGHIGAGYSYLGHYGQIAYALPAMGGLSLSAAVMSPVNAFANANATAGRSPQVQGLAAYATGSTKLWLAAKSQPFKGNATQPGFTMSGVELGGSAAFGSFGLLANLQKGKGLGVLADGDNGDQKQTNWVLQGTMTLDKLKLGLSVGETRLDGGTGTDLKKNANTTLGAYYSLTKSVTLVGELSRTSSASAAGDTARMSGAALGGILFF